MSTLTKEWLQQTIAELEEERDAVPGAVNEDAAKTLAAMKRALASLEAEPLGYIDAEYAGLLKSGHIESCSVYAEPGEGCIALYAAQPAPVVPDGDLMLRIDEIERHTLTAGECAQQSKVMLISSIKRLNACRAAMLQGAELVTTANKLPEPIKDNRLNSGQEADDYYSGYQAGWNECLETVQVIYEGNPDAK